MLRRIATWSLCLLTSCANAAYEPRSEAGAVEGLAAYDVAVPASAMEPVADPAVPETLEAQAPEAPSRQVIYSAALRVVVVSADAASSAVLALAKDSGGFLQESDARAITVRVPAARFEELLARIASLGEVVERSVRASDVTEQMFDVDLRLENARKARERLLELLSRSTKIEDTLAIEAELTRVSGEIEQMEGKLRFLKLQVAMSTIRVEWNARAAPRPGSGERLGLPFPWIDRLGDGLVAGTVKTQTREASWFERWFGMSFDAPAAFLRYYASDERIEALDADGLRLKVQRHDNHDEGALAFWTKLARRALVEGRSLSIRRESELGPGRAVIVGSREVGGQALGYLLVIARTPDEIHVFEAWGPRDAFDRREAELIESAKSLRP